MNILILAKHLKEFTLDEINMITEVDCKTELERLFNTHKISFEQGVYKYVENSTTENFSIFVDIKYHKNQQNFEKAVKSFMTKHVENFCSKNTRKSYHSLFKTNILPFFVNIKLNKITNQNITDFYAYCFNKGLSPRRIKNTFALLNQLLRYCQTKGWIKNCCNFQVRRLTSKNEFSLNRIIFERN